MFVTESRISTNILMNDYWRMTEVIVPVQMCNSLRNDMPDGSVKKQYQLC